MTAYTPDDGVDPVESELDEQFRKVEESRHVDKRQKWWLFAGFVMSVLALAIAIPTGFYLVSQAYQDLANSDERAANERVEKKQIAEEARQAICESGSTAIYDIDLCNRLATVASEPIQGNPGKQGPMGPRGEPGRDGLPGRVGPQGIRGMMGEIGRPGRDGKDGESIAGPAGPAGQDGRDGIDGQQGPPGADSTVPGPQGPAGPPGADSTVPGPAGPPGPAGADSTVPGPAGPSGPTGAQGVSIVDVDCVGDGADSTWQITLSNGEVLNGGGPCKVNGNGPPIEVGTP